MKKLRHFDCQMFLIVRFGSHQVATVQPPLVATKNRLKYLGKDKIWDGETSLYGMLELEDEF